MREVPKIKLHLHQGPLIIWLQWPPLSPLHFMYPASNRQRKNRRSLFFKHMLPLHYPSPCIWHYSCYLDTPSFFPYVDFTVQPKQHLSCEFFRLPQQLVIPSIGYTYNEVWHGINHVIL